MKTPWKFLAQLTSRRPSAKAQQSSIGNSADSKAFESEAEHTPALRLSLRVAASPPAHDEEVSVDHASMASDKAKGDDDVAQALKQAIDAEAAQTTARHQVDHSGAEANSLVPNSAASTKSHGKPRVKRRERGKNANGESTAQSAVAPKSHQSLQASSSRDLFFQQAATLDEEIKMLRIHLAHKLQLQNGQLKKMLERFDVS
ncbi:MULTISPECIES: hypothetical protein [Sinorhizobium]|uniref:hypothetical protein n=1 Tax=Sinorhizobium TaxID=28105 RepID=UPI000BE9E3B2|nr:MULTISPECIES: hypothetical protein [Sinorhizobium]PDT50838.1 hypothetical protein CO664_24015 [Sinorhizobium sp. NG07B]POH24959.1 hypothetical protein ATY30_28330 [Sinorhizobium americanum]